MDVAEKPWLHSRAWWWARFKRPSLAAILLASASIVFLFLLQPSSSPPETPFSPPATAAPISGSRPPVPQSCAGFYDAGPPRKAVFSIQEFGGVGDGLTVNTAAFRRAVERCREFGDKGGAMLNVPAGRWLTGSFNLSSNFTLFLHDGAVILGSEDPKEWPLIEPLVSYGRGRERPGGRHISLIHGSGLHDVVLTGQNGSIDGQGNIWWDLWWNRTLEHTRGHLVELVDSKNILISNLTFRNSPFWTIHPVYCSNVLMKNLTVLAPLHSPNTDGIDPDSSTNICIEDCYIESGDDMIAIKSGWDQYGVAAARPSSNIIIRRISGTTPTCSAVGIGSEMSGGISDILIEDLHVWDSAAAVRIKTDRGRGGYITNVTITNVKMERVRIPIRFSRGSNDHPDDGWDPRALPQVNIINISNVSSFQAERAPILEGVEGAKFQGLCLKNINLRIIRHDTKWHCENIDGEAYNVLPVPCPQLRRNQTSSKCFH
ncbi:probable polygalacturonase [Phalaenopsis equestris]|uniref:probable polygalacturonase n=1 Tax=Phalaenopsis equestris TaxID=78828 RepID=UPI0009E3D235|nr:probable polygalacturonase [Phalaenopsis equestris]